MGYAEVRFLIPGYGKNRPRSKEKRRQMIKIRERDGDNCWICDNPIDFDLPRDHDEAGTLDHVVPFSRGGSNLLENLRIAHRICGDRRGAPDIK